MKKADRMEAGALHQLVEAWTPPEWVYQFGERFNSREAMIALRLKEGAYDAAPSHHKAEAEWRAMALEYAMQQHTSHGGVRKAYTAIGKTVGISGWTLERWDHQVRGVPINLWPVFLAPKRRANPASPIADVAEAIVAAQKRPGLSSGEIVSRIKGKLSIRTIQRLRKAGIVGR